MRTSGLLGAGGGGAAGAGAGAAGWAELGAVAEAVLSRIHAVQTACACRHLSTFAISLAGELPQADLRLLTPFGVLRPARAALRRVRAFAARLLPACSERDSRLDSLGELFCLLQREPRVHAGTHFSPYPRNSARRQRIVIQQSNARQKSNNQIPLSYPTPKLNQQQSKSRENPGKCGTL
jgi:hypothetical protein